MRTYSAVTPRGDQDTHILLGCARSTAHIYIFLVPSQPPVHLLLVVNGSLVWARQIAM